MDLPSLLPHAMSFRDRQGEEVLEGGSQKAVGGNRFWEDAWRAGAEANWLRPECRLHRRAHIVLRANADTAATLRLGAGGAVE
jgi:hypothetical protein